MITQQPRDHEGLHTTKNGKVKEEGESGTWKGRLFETLKTYPTFPAGLEAVLLLLFECIPCT